MVVPSRFLRLELLPVRSRDQLGPNYTKLPVDTDGEGRRLRRSRSPLRTPAPASLSAPAHSYPRNLKTGRSYRYEAIFVL